MDIDKKAAVVCLGLVVLVLAVLLSPLICMSIWGYSSKFRGNWIKESDESILEISDSHIIQRSKNQSVIYRYTVTPAGNYIFVDGERGSVEVNGNRMIIGTGTFAGIYRRLGNHKPPEPPAEVASVTLGKKMDALASKMKSVGQKNNVLMQEVVDLNRALERMGVRSSDNLTTPESKRLAKELAEVVMQQQELNAQYSDMIKILEEGRSLQRRLAREEMISNGKIPNDQLRQQLGEITESIAKLDERFRNTGTITAQDAINKIIDEQLKR